VYQLLNVRQEIIKNMQSALDNPAHLNTLYEKCEEAGFNTSIYDPPVVLGEGIDGIFTSSITGNNCKR
jgi:hypothetical protein